MRPIRVGVLTLAASATAVILTAPTASAANGQVSAQYQGYGTASGGTDPYANDNPQDVHVDGFGGQPVVTGFIKLNLDSLGTGATINGLELKLTPNSSQSDNVNSAAASIEACLLTQPLSSNGYQSTPPTYDCTTHVNGEPQSDGTWNFELQPLAQRWEHGQNTGLALVAFSPPNGTPVTQASPSAWSVAFDHTKTTGTVDYQPGSLSSSSFFSGAVPAVPPAAASGNGIGVAPAPAVNPAPAPAVSTPPPATPTARPSSVARPSAIGQPRSTNNWVWIAVALLGAVVLMVVVTAAQQVMRGGSLSFLKRTGAALAASRSQLATPVAVLAMASVFALGFAGQLPGLASQGGSGGTSSGSSGSASPGAFAAPGGSGSAGGGGASGGGTGGSAASSAAAAAAASTNGGQDGIGVTSTTVRLGFVYVTNSQAANDAFGVHVANTGNQQAEEQALVTYINKHGGIGGRQIQPVYVSEDNAQAETDPTIGEEMCKTMTEDYHVFAVIGGAGPPDDWESNACYAEAGTLNFDGEQAAPDLAFLKQASPYIWMTEDAALDRTMRWEIAGLQSRGYFAKPATGNNKLGVIIAQDPVNQRVWQQVTLPALQAAGVSNPDTFYVPHDTISDIANTMKQAVVRFQVDGVTNVMFQGGGNYGAGSYALLFMLDAESQHYTPRYGLSSDDAPVALVGNVPQDQFQNALAVGTIPGADTDDQHYGQWPYTPGEKQCGAIEAAAGNSFTSREGALVIIDLCDSMFELQDGAAALVNQPLNAQLWANQVMKLGSNIFNAGMYKRFIGPGHWDAAGGYRLLHAVLNCEGSNACFEYDNSNTYG